MSGFADVMAFQGTGMAGRPSNLAPDDLVLDVRAKSIEYRMGEILRSGGFSDEQTRAIINALLPSVVAGRSLDAANITSRLIEAGFASAVAAAISQNITIGGRR